MTVWHVCIVAASLSCQPAMHDTARLTSLGRKHPLCCNSCVGLYRVKHTWGCLCVVALQRPVCFSASLASLPPPCSHYRKDIQPFFLPSFCFFDLKCYCRWGTWASAVQPFGNKADEGVQQLKQPQENGRKDGIESQLDTMHGL